MPRNQAGVYSLPAGYLAVTGQIIQAAQHNTPLEDIAADLNDIAADLSAVESQLLTSDFTVTVPTQYPTLQAAVNALGVLRAASGVRKIVLIEAGHQPTSGLSLSRGDWSDITIRSQDSIVTLAAGFVPHPSAGEFIRVSGGKAPRIEALFDLANRADRGLHCDNFCEFSIGGGSGFINAAMHNLEVRASRGTANNAILTGAGDTGLRIQRNSVVRATSVNVSNAYRAGVDVSRGSIAEIQELIAQDCGVGYFTEVDPNFINQGALLARRSWVVAQPMDGSGSSRGISAQLGAKVIANECDLRDCLAHGVRVTSGADVNVSSSTSDLSGSGNWALQAGAGGKITAQNANLGDGSISCFGSGATIDISEATYTAVPSAGGEDLPINSFSPRGWIIDNARPTIVRAEVFQTVTFTLEPGEAAFFTPPGSGGARRLLFSVVSDAFGETALISARLINAAIDKVGSSNMDNEIDITTGALSGTTGAQGKITVSADGAGGGRIWIENRRNNTKDIAVTVLAMNKTS